MLSAVSKLSARRGAMPSRTTSRSTTASISCLVLRFSAGTSAISYSVTVNLHPREAAALQFGKLLTILALAVAHDRGEQQQPGPFRHRCHAIHHLRHVCASIGRPVAGEYARRLAPRAGACSRGFLSPCRRRARVFRGGLLLEGDRGRQAVDAVDVGFAHQLQELAGIGRERFDVAALALGIDRVERQG